jgi:hypothetical protein
MVRLYQPGGRPVPDSSAVELGRAARLEVPAEDATPGVYELDLVATPFAPVTASVRAEVSPLELEPASGLEARNPSSQTVAGVLHEALRGAERVYQVSGQGRDTLSVTPPAWATTAVIDVSLPEAQWDEMTGFGVTVFDSTGLVVAAGPLDGAAGRTVVPLPLALRGRPLAIELEPAFVRATPWQASVRVDFLLSDPAPLGAARPVVVVGGGRVTLASPAVPALIMPPGFAPLVSARVQRTGGAEALRSFTVGP